MIIRKCLWHPAKRWEFPGKILIQVPPFLNYLKKYRTQTQSLFCGKNKVIRGIGELPHPVQWRTCIFYHSNPRHPYSTWIWLVFVKGTVYTISRIVLTQIEPHPHCVFKWILRGHLKTTTKCKNINHVWIHFYQILIVSKYHRRLSPCWSLLVFWNIH